jgi:hypothetical protein
MVIAIDGNSSFFDAFGEGFSEAFSNLKKRNQIG